MKKIIQISLLVVLAAVLVLGAIPVIRWTGGIIQPLVGWNTGVSWDAPDTLPMAALTGPTFMRLSIGWNT